MSIWLTPRVFRVSLLLVAFASLLQLAQTAVPADAASPGGQIGIAPAQGVDEETVIRNLIVRANMQQVEALATGDPTIMRNTATDRYYREMVRTDTMLRQEGIDEIDLVDLEWGPIVIDGPTAEVTTYETWATRIGDQWLVQRPERNIYTLIRENGVWRIDGNEHPDVPPAPPTRDFQTLRPDLANIDTF